MKGQINCVEWSTEVKEDWDGGAPFGYVAVCQAGGSY